MRRSRFHAVVLACISGLVFSSCSSARVRGDSESRSSRRSDRVVSRDRIPARQSSYRIRGTDETGVLTDAQKARLRSKTRSWRWPTEWVTVTSSFGSRQGEHHDGLDLRATSGTPIYAAADGKVIYAAAKIRGYGRMIVLRHGGRLSTIYAHNSKLYVKPSQQVRRGQLIALSGNTGHSTGPHLHFEVREGVTAINPMILLPSPAVANEATRRIASVGNRRPGRVRSTASSARRSSSRGTKAAKHRYTQSSPARLNGHIAARVADGDGFRPKSPRKN
jgi:hypothetical protein